MRSVYRVTVLWLALAVALPAFSQTLPRGVQRVTAAQGITEYSLPNGLHVLLIPDASKPKIAVTISYLINLGAFKLLRQKFGLSTMWATAWAIPPSTIVVFLLLNYRVFAA